MKQKLFEITCLAIFLVSCFVYANAQETVGDTMTQFGDDYCDIEVANLFHNRVIFVDWSNDCHKGGETISPYIFLMKEGPCNGYVGGDKTEPYYIIEQTFYIFGSQYQKCDGQAEVYGVIQPYKIGRVR